MAEGDVVGTASVNIEAIVTVNEESLVEAKGQIAKGLNADVSTPEGRPAGRGRPATGVPATATVDAKVKAKVEGQISKDVQAAIDATDYQLTIDSGDIRRQIQDALRAPFDITVNAEINGSAASLERVGTTHGGATVTGGATTQAPIPQEITQLLRENKGALATNINNLYRNINEAFAAAGKGRFGRQSIEGTGNEVQKLAEIMDRFGSSFSDLATLTKTNKITSGSLSPKELAAALGIDPTHPAIQTVAQSGVPGLLTGAPGGGDPARKIGVLMSRVANWSATAPMAGPAAAAEPTIPAHEQRAMDTSARVDAEKQRADAKQAVIAERQASLRITPLTSEFFPSAAHTGRQTPRPPNSSFIGPTLPGMQFPTELATGEDPEAERRARYGLGGRERANVRRLRGRGTVISFGGRQVDLESYLRAAEMGQFQDIFEQFGGKGGRESQGLRRFEAQDVGGFDELSRLGRRKPGVKFSVAGQEGRFARVQPSEALARTIIRDLGIEEDAASAEQVRAQLEAQSENIRKATAQGASPLRGVGGATKRGQGAPTTEGASDLGKESRKLFEFIDYLDERIQTTTEMLEDVNRDLSAAGTARERKPLERRAQGLEQRLAGLRGRRGEAVQALEAQMTEPQPVNREATRQRAAESRRAVEAGVGFTEAELLERQLKSPGAQGRYAAQLMEEMGLPEPVSDILLRRFRESTDRPEGRGGMRVLRQTAFGPRGRASRSPKESEGLFGEMVSRIPADMGPDARSTLVSALKEELQATIEEEQSRRDAAEAEIAKKEGATTRGLGRRRTVASALATEPEIGPGGLPVAPTRTAFEAPVTGEGLFKSRARDTGEVYVGGPGQTGRTRASTARSAGIATGAITPPPGTEYPGEDPATLARVQAEGEARAVFMSAADEEAAETRQRTLGRGKYQTGAQTEQIAREAGVTMQEEPPMAPWAYLAGAGGAGGAGGGGGGAGGGFAAIGGAGGGGVTGGVPVVVMNWPEGFGRGGGRGGGRGRVTAEGAEQPEEQPAEAQEPRNRQLEAAMERDFVAALRGQNDPRARQAYEARVEAREQRYLAGASPTPVERDFLAALQQANRPEKAAGRAALIGVPSRERAEQEALRAGIQLNLPDPGVSGTLTAAPSDVVLRANAARQRAQRSLPQRAISTSFVQIAENLFGGLDAPQQRLATLANRTQDVNALATQQTRLREARRGTLGEIRLLGRGATATEAAGGDAREQRARIKGLTDEFMTLTKTSKQVNAALISGAREVEGLAASAVTATDVVRNLAAGAVGGVVGGLAAGAVMQVSQAVIQTSAEVLAPIFERLSGFGGTTGRVQGDLAKELRANNDRLASTLAQTGILARLDDDQLAQVSQPLGQRAGVVAGTQSLQQQFELFNVANAIRDQTQGGFDRGLTRTTGGLFDVRLPFKAFGVQDISIGGQASTAEILTSQLSNLNKPSQYQPSGPQTLGSRDPRRFNNAGQVIQNEVPGQPANDKLIAENNAQLKFLNSSLKSFQLVTTDNTEALDKQALIFAEGGAADLGGRLRERGVIAQGVQGPQDVAQLLAEFAAGPKLSARQLLETQRPQIEAQIALEDMQRRFQTGTVNPQTFAIAEAARPLGPAAAGIDTTGLTKEQAAGVNAELAQTQKLYDQINQETEAGVAAAKEFVATTFNYDPKVGQQFADSLDHVAEIGKQITSIEIGLQTKQAAFSAAQFSYQIDLAKRSLSDAKGLVSGVGDSLGAVERRIYDLNRQSQALSLGQSQRQINFQTALANFQAPGLSSEEAEARIAQAKTEAEFAQKQLNIQKQLFGLSGRGFNIQARRQVQDLNRQIDLLERGRVLSVETAAAEKKIIALTKIAAKENRQVETFYNTAVTRTGEINAKIVELVAASQEAMSDVGNIVLRQFRNTYQGMITIISGGNESNAEIAAGGGADRHNAMGWLGMGDYTHAEGWMGTVNGATSFGKYGVAGEAGGEAVAILRDPKMLASPSGGGGGDTFVVNIYNPVVKSDDDKRRLIADVKRALQSEASMLLPRRA